MSEVRIPYEWAHKALELALNYGVDSLRVGSYERKDIMENHPAYTFQTVQLREKREQSRMALAHHLFSAVEYDTADPKAECTNSDTWNCKYCKKNTACDALKDYRSSGGTVKPEPEDKPDTVAASNGLKVNVELLCNKLGTARVAVADAEANLKLLRDVVESQETQREKELSNMVERFVAAFDHVDPSSGVCMCGDDMENHGDPDMTGHCPVDSGHYAATNLLNSARKLIGKN